MQNAGQYVPGTAHPPQQFVPSEPSPNGGSTTSSLRQFRKRDVDKSQLEPSPKQESHVARVAPHNHYPPVSNDLYRYPSHQFSDYSSQVKYSDIADPSQPNPISTSVIQKPKPKDYMEMCNVQQQHLNNQQQYSLDNGQYMHRDPTQGYPTGYKPEAHYLTKDQHQYQQLAPHHNGQPKMNSMMPQNMRKYNPGPDNPFLNKLSKIHPSMARSIISDHHLQEAQPSYASMDQRGMYGQQSHRYYAGSLHQSNPYAPNPNYSINPPHHYPSYPSASCSFPRTPTINPRYSHMERSISPTRRGYPENMHMNHLSYQNIPHKMQPYANYSLQYAGGPEYAQHYQHRRMGQDYYPQPGRPPQYIQGHQQMPAQEMQDHPESRISPSDSLKKFIENWGVDEEPTNEINPMDGNMNLRDKVSDAPPGTVYMINATDVQYFENNGIPIVTSDNGGIQLTSENYQYLLKNSLVDNSGMVRIIEANKEISIDSSGNQERIVNLQIMETSKSDCMMVSKSLRPNDGSVGSNGMIPKTEEEKRVVIHQNTVISPGNSVVSERIPSQQPPPPQAPMNDLVVESTSINKELVDKNCSPINLDQLEHNLGFSEPDPPETENDKLQTTIPVSTINSYAEDSENISTNCKPSVLSTSEDISQNSDDNQNKSPESKSMPIIDLFGEPQLKENEISSEPAQKETNMLEKKEEHDIITDQITEPSVIKETSCNASPNADKDETNCEKVDEMVETRQEESDEGPVSPDISKKDGICSGTFETMSATDSVIVCTEVLNMESVLKEETTCFENTAIESFHEPLTIIPSTSKEVDNIKISEPLIKDCEKQSVLENSTVLTELNRTEVVSKSIGSENMPNIVEESKISVDLTTSERRKRIFSVDDIMNHIGNNMKRGLRDIDICCTTETLKHFMEKEIEFSSLEQALNLYYIRKKFSVRVNEDILPLDDKTVGEIVNSEHLKSKESKKSVLCTDQIRVLEDTEDCQNLESEELLNNMKDSDIIPDTNSSIEESIVDDEKLIHNISEEKLDSIENRIQIESTDDRMEPELRQEPEPELTQDSIQTESTIDKKEVIHDHKLQEVREEPDLPEIRIQTKSIEDGIQIPSTIANNESIPFDKVPDALWVKEENTTEDHIYTDSTINSVQTESTIDNKIIIHDDELQQKIMVKELGLTENSINTKSTIIDNQKYSDIVHDEIGKLDMECTEDIIHTSFTIDKTEIIPDVIESENDVGEQELNSTEEIIQATSDPSTIPVVLEHDERSNTPSGFQFRNAIRIEESSVLLQIAGELMEINVNVVNGKKVITVVPLADSTEVDYNDNYEVSTAIQDMETAVQLDDSRIESEKIEIAKSFKEKESDIYNGNKSFDPEQSIAALENQKESTDSLEEISNVLSYEEENKGESNNTEEHLDKVQQSLDSEEPKFDTLCKESRIQVQKENVCIISSEANLSPKIDKFIVGGSKSDEETELKSENDLVQKEIMESQSEVANTDRSEITETYENFDNTIQVSEEVEASNIEEFVAEETVKFIDGLNIDATNQISEDIEADNIEEFVVEETVKSTNETGIVQDDEPSELITDSETIQLAETLDPTTLEENLKTKENIKLTKNSTSNIYYSANDLTGAKDLILPEGKRINYDGHVIPNCSSEKEIYDTEHIEELPYFQDEAVPTTEAECVQYSSEGSFHDDLIVEDNENDIDTESFNYPLEDDVFITAEPSHEIIVSDPLEGVALVEEVDKTFDSFDISLEPVTASDDIVETSEVFSRENFDVNTQEDDHNEGPLEEINKSLPKGISRDPQKVLPTFHTKEEIVHTSAPDLKDRVDKVISKATKLKEIPVVKIERTKELIIKISKPEVQILSPTSTNIEDPVTLSKENVYLEPRRRVTTDDESENTFASIATKAAKKLYECDLQIPAVTTSGDISTKISKKSMKCQHDTVSSSKKDMIVKDLLKNRKSVLKRSKRINEKNQIKNEQKEMLKLLAEKRKQKKEAKQKEAIKQKEEGRYTEETKETKDNLTEPSVVENTPKSRNRHSTETDDEYADFKELLRARKMKKLKKMQELKRREAKDNKVRTEEASKNVKDGNKVTIKKAAIVIKPNIVTSSLVQENNTEIRTIGVSFNTSSKKSEKHDKQRSKKRKNSSDGVKALKVKTNSSKTEIVNSELGAVKGKLNIVPAVPVENKVSNIIAAEIKSDADDSKLKKNSPPAEIKCTDSQPTIMMDDAVEEQLKDSVPHLEPLIENHHILKKAKLQKRVSFCDDISSSTLHDDADTLLTNEDKVSSKVRTHSITHPKDPRRRSKSYSGRVIVPSVSELIEENSGSIYKKKITLADYVSRKRKNSTEKSEVTKPEEKEFTESKKSKLNNSVHKKEEFVAEPLTSKETEPSNCKLDEDKPDAKDRNSYKLEEGNKISKKTLKDVKTSFVIHSSDWEDSQSPLPTIIQSNEECLIEDFSGLIKTKSKRPVIDVNELTPLEIVENPKDKKLQEYKDKVDSQLSSLNIQIPKIKPQNLENKQNKLSSNPYGSPESSSLIKKFLSSEKITESEMERIKKIISYKRLMQHQKNCRSPSKSPASSISTYSQSSACSSYEPICSVAAYSASSSDPTYEIKNHRKRSETDSRETRLHLKKVNAKRKLHVEYDDEGSSSVYSNQSESRYKKPVDYSVINRLGKDGLPKIIFKRNRQSNISDNIQLVVELERIDNNLELVEEKYNVTVRR